MLLSCDARHGLEPVGEVGGALAYRPVLHGGSHHIGHSGIQGRALVNGAPECAVDILGEPLPHDRVVKNHAAKEFRDLTHQNIPPWSPPEEGTNKKEHCGQGRSVLAAWKSL